MNPYFPSTSLVGFDFHESGWEVKRLVRQIVLSATYRQSAATDKSVIAVDPKNQKLARGPRFRMDSEMIRDMALAARYAQGYRESCGAVSSAGPSIVRVIFSETITVATIIRCASQCGWRKEDFREDVRLLKELM